MYKLAQMASPLDYKDSSLDLRVDGEKLDTFRVTGFVTELALKVSKRVGCSTLQARHLPGSIVVRLDHRGRRPVRVYDENRDLAVTVAKALRKDIHAAGLEMCQGLLEVKNAAGKRVGEHDLTLEFVDTPAAPAGILSAEVKLRRLYSENGKEKVRKALQVECEEQCSWWQHELQKAPGHWAGRLIILVVFSSAGMLFTSYGDLKLQGWSNFRGLWGWQGSSRSLARAPSTPPPPAIQRALPTPKAASKTLRAAPARPTWDHFKKEKKLRFRTEEGARVGSVPGLLKAKEVDANHIGDLVRTGKRRHKWTDRMVFKAPRVGSKKGGESEWVATEEVLQQVYEDY